MVNHTYIHTDPYIYTHVNCTGAQSRWVDLGSNVQCNAGAGEVYRSQSPGKVSDIAACQKSCEVDAGCKSITLFKSGWCSHFSTECKKTKSTNKAISMRLGVARVTTKAPISTGAVNRFDNYKQLSRLNSSCLVKDVSIFLVSATSVHCSYHEKKIIS